MGVTSWLTSAKPSACSQAQAVQALATACPTTTSETTSPEDGQELSYITPQDFRNAFTDMMRILQVQYPVLVDRFDALNDRRSVMLYASNQATEVPMDMKDRWEENTEIYTEESRELIGDILRNINLTCWLLRDPAACSKDDISSYRETITSVGEDIEECERVTTKVRDTTACIAAAYGIVKPRGEPHVFFPSGGTPNAAEDLLGPLEALWNSYDAMVGGDRLFPHERDGGGQTGFGRFISGDSKHESQCKFKAVPVNMEASPVSGEVSDSLRTESSGEESDGPGEGGEVQGEIVGRDRES